MVVAEDQQLLIIIGVWSCGEHTLETDDGGKMERWKDGKVERRSSRNSSLLRYCLRCDYLTLWQLDIFLAL